MKSSSRYTRKPPRHGSCSKHHCAGSAGELVSWGLTSGSARSRNSAHGSGWGAVVASRHQTRRGERPLRLIRVLQRGALHPSPRHKAAAAAAGAAARPRQRRGLGGSCHALACRASVLVDAPTGRAWIAHGSGIGPTPPMGSSAPGKLSGEYGPTFTSGSGAAVSISGPRWTRRGDGFGCTLESSTATS